MCINSSCSPGAPSWTESADFWGGGVVPRTYRKRLKKKQAVVMSYMCSLMLQERDGGVPPHRGGAAGSVSPEDHHGREHHDHGAG